MPRGDSYGKIVTAGRRDGSLRPGGAGMLSPEERSALFHASPWTVLRRRRGSVLLVAAVCVALVGVLTALTPKRWTSTATILVEPQDGGSDEGDLLRRFGRVSQVETEIAMLTSRTVLGPAVEALDLHVDVVRDGESVDPRLYFHELKTDSVTTGASYRVQAMNTGVAIVSDGGSGRELGRAEPGTVFQTEGIRFVLAEAPAGVITVRVSPFTLAVAETLERVSVRRAAEDADLIELTCHGGSAERAEALCQEISASYMRLRTTLQRAEATATAQFLDDQVRNLHGLLLAAEDSLEGLARQTEVVDLEGQATETARRYADLSAERDGLVRERAALAELVAGVNVGEGANRWRDVASFPTFLANPIVASLVTTVVGLENQRADLASRRTLRDPDLAAVSSRIREIDDQLRGFASSYQASLEAQIRSVDRSLETAASRLGRFPAKQVQFARFQRQAELLGNLYRLLETRRREAQVAEAVDLPSVRIMDEASYPLEPSAPLWPRNMALAGLLGIAGGLGLAFFRDVVDTRLHERREVELETGHSVVGLLPSLHRPGAVFDGRLIRRRIPRSEASARRQEVMQEAFRGLLTDVRFAALKSNVGDVRSIAVLSASPGEGKTFTAANMALARASVGSRTLLIDADMRAAGVSRFLGLPPIAGLSEVLEGRASPFDVLRDVGISQSGPLSSGKLTVLPAGRPTPHSAALLQDGAFGAVLDTLAEGFELIVVDTPPLNVLSDGMTISAAVDGVLVVVRGGRTDRDALDLAMERLDRVGAPVLGLVLNDVAVPRHYGEYKRAYSQLTAASAGWAGVGIE